MSFAENNYSPEFLLGDVQIDRNNLAALRASSRRTDPDGSSNVPYYPDAGGKFLRVTYTTEPAVAEVVADIELTSDSLAQIILDINAESPANIQALDLGGYLVIRNLNQGKTHFIKVTAYDVEADDAAPVLGFVVGPYPGHISYVGEVATTPGTRAQSNRQGTSLVANAEDLRPGALNRVFASILNLIQTNIQDLERPAIVYKYKFFAAATLQVPTGEYYVNIADDDILLPIYVPTNTGETIGDVPARYWMKPFIGSASLDGGGGMYVAFDSTDTVVGDWTAPTRNELTVADVSYSDGSQNIDILNTAGVGFAAWGTPDGKSIYGVGYGTGVDNLDKQVEVDVTSIDGNIVYCEDAEFVTNLIRKGDPVYMVATGVVPFDHSGWFAVKEVYDETHVALRPMSASELIPTDPLAHDIKPRSLNPNGGGTLTIKVGYHIPAGNALVVLRPKSAVSNLVLRIPCVVPLKEAIAGNLGVIAGATVDLGLVMLNNHILRVDKDAHPAKAIKAYASTTFPDGSSIAGLSMRLDQFLDQLITLLGSSTASPGGGSKRIGAEAVTLSGGTPTAYAGLDRSIAAGTVDSQLLNVLTKLRDHEVDGTRHDVHGVLSGTGISGTAALNLTLVGGACIVYGRYFSPPGAVLALANNNTSWVYVNSLTGVYTATTNAATACANSELALYKVTTSGGAITVISDVRRWCVPNRNRKFWTVGSAGSINCDFTSLNGAFDFLAEYRATTGVQTVEIVIQGDVAVPRTILLTFPVTIRGAAIDGDLLVGGPLARIVGGSGIPIFRTNVSDLHNCVFKDLYIQMDGAPALNTGFGSNSTGDNWVFENVVFANGPTSDQVMNLSSDSSISKDWKFINCRFLDKGVGSFINISDNLQGYLFQNCSFYGPPNDMDYLGVYFLGNSSEFLFDNCLFDLGGIGIVSQGTAGMITARNCRFKNAVDTAVWMNTVTGGDVYLENCRFIDCMHAPDQHDAIVEVTAGTRSCIMRGCVFENWAADKFVFTNIGNTGTHHKMIDCAMTATAATRAIAASNLHMSGCDFDLAVGAASGMGSNVTTVVSLGDNCRAINNRFDNCGSTATANSNTVLSADNNNVIQGNQFFNCRGDLITTLANRNVVMGNIGVDVGTSADDEGVIISGTHTVAMGNVMGHTGSGKPINVTLSDLHAHVIGNAVEVAVDTSFASGLAGGIIRKLITYDPGSQNVIGGVTKSLSFVPMPADVYGSHLPEQIGVPPKVANIEPGVRVTYGDGTTDVHFNTTGLDQYYLFIDDGVSPYFLADNDKTITAVEFVARNVGATDTQTLGNFRYHGWVVG